MSRAMPEICTLTFLLTATLADAATGSLRGRVIDARDQTPIAGAVISVAEQAEETETDPEGAFTMENVGAGTRTIVVSAEGYQALALTDVVVRPGRQTTVTATLQANPFDGGEVVVTTDYFVRDADQPVSGSYFSAEEVRKAPGAAGDISRMVAGLPSVAKVNDTSNGLLVRGGSVLENGFYLDNIEVPNINHFPSQGASGGAVSLLNVDLVQDVNFRAGGFGAAYGDRLSSVMDITLREGNRTEMDGQLDVSFAGVGGLLEGPLGNGKGSWVFSARRSYVDLLVDAFDTGTSVAPRFGDGQGKLVWDLSGQHQLTAIGLYSDDHSRSTIADARDNDMLSYGGQDLNQGVAGLNWRALWGDRGLSNTSLSFSGSRYREDFFERGTEAALLRNDSSEYALSLRNVNEVWLREGLSVTFGTEAKMQQARYDSQYAASTDWLGNPVPDLQVDEELKGARAAVFGSASLRVAPGLTATAGVRGDWGSLSGNTTVSPRLGLSWEATRHTRFSAAAGLFRQSLPLVLLAQQQQNRDLEDLQAIHFTVGAEHLLTDSLKLGAEAYWKGYDKLPVDPTQPELFLMDELQAGHSFFRAHGPLSSEGQARAAGIELTLQKKLARDFYGLAGASFSSTQYRGADGVWRDRVSDNRYLFSLEGGYKPGQRWQINARWVYAGGPPFTPLDLEASALQGRTILDDTRIHEERFEAYHSLDLRVERRFYFSGSNLAVSLGAWNVYGRKNVSNVFWNETKGAQDDVRQWGLLPVLGLEYEF